MLQAPEGKAIKEISPNIGNEVLYKHQSSSNLFFYIENLLNVTLANKETVTLKKKNPHHPHLLRLYQNMPGCVLERPF